ncbi:MAG TPA: biotin/lipoate A/B protein ligase family protein [Pirellulales bacterium]|nr:biotin/lipoate A/B protein ligase family protein [Pirellulales bacterium]
MDEVLMDRAVVEARPQLRIYGWDEPTVSIGYFQSITERESHPPSCGCPLVRRPSGGGAIVHDREITYALAIPGAWRASEQRDFYRRVHQGLVELLVRLGADASLYARPAVGQAASDPFLCFQRRMEGDVVIGACKVIGSAQRRGKGAVVQHGTVLLNASPAAPELPGIEDLSAIRLEREEWAWQVRDAVTGALDLEPEDVPLRERERAAAQRTVDQKHGRKEWCARR